MDNLNPKWLTRPLSRVALAALCASLITMPAFAGEAAPPAAVAAPDAAAPPAGKPPADAEAFELSDAQKMLFDSNHLGSIKEPTVLRYSFARSGIYKDDFKDEVKVKIDRVQADGAKDVSFDVFTGDRNKYYPPVEHFHGNPLIMILLQRDTFEMKRVLFGNANYYRNMIRYGFHDAAEVTDVTVDGPNGPVKAKKIVVKPFAKERPQRQEQAMVHDKSYEYILSPEIPGQIYSITTVTPQEAGKAGGNLLEEKLVFQGTDPAPQAGVSN